MTPRRYVGTSRACSKCGQSAPWPDGFYGADTATCKPCYRAQVAARTRKRKRETPTPSPVVPTTRVGRMAAEAKRRLAAGLPSAFDATLAECKAQWGEMHTWTRAHHRAHNSMMLRLLGVEEDRAP